uniref:Uncharacterized protein n=1 Tax=Mustela putorius furo TaxID=9669 RepID=M3Y813_MUSPF
RLGAARGVGQAAAIFSVGGACATRLSSGGRPAEPGRHLRLPLASARPPHARPGRGAAGRLVGVFRRRRGPGSSPPPAGGSGADGATCSPPSRRPERGQAELGHLMPQERSWCSGLLLFLSVRPMRHPWVLSVHRLRDFSDFLGA